MTWIDPHQHPVRWCVLRCLSVVFATVGVLYVIASLIASTPGTPVTTKVGGMNFAFRTEQPWDLPEMSFGLVFALPAAAAAARARAARHRTARIVTASLWCLTFGLWVGLIVKGADRLLQLTHGLWASAGPSAVALWLASTTIAAGTATAALMMLLTRSVAVGGGLLAASIAAGACYIWQDASNRIGPPLVWHMISVATLVWFALRPPSNPRACRNCKYSLRGLTGDRCPECGAAIPESTFSELLSAP